MTDTIVQELGLKGPADLDGFDHSLGAAFAYGWSFFNRGTAGAAEGWQILSPVRGLSHGVPEINRLIHRQFRSRMLERAREKYRKIPALMGSEEIIYGDKVINVANHPRDKVYPLTGSAKYIANGEIGLVVGQYKTRKMKKMKGPPWLTQVEFSSQVGFTYDYSKRDFREESDPYLELAYALTVHKSQGSEFDMVICQPTAHRFAFSDSASLRVGQTRADSASLRFVPVMMSSHRGAPASPLTLGGVESSVSHGRRPLRESLDIRTLPPSRRPRPSRERQTGVTGRFPVRRAEPTFLADEMSAPADFLVNDAVSEERTSGRSDALSVRSYPGAS